MTLQEITAITFACEREADREISESRQSLDTSAVVFHVTTRVATTTLEDRSEKTILAEAAKAQAKIARSVTRADVGTERRPERPRTSYWLFVL